MVIEHLNIRLLTTSGKRCVGKWFQETISRASEGPNETGYAGVGS